MNISTIKVLCNYEYFYYKGSVQPWTFLRWSFCATMNVSTSKVVCGYFSFYYEGSVQLWMLRFCATTIWMYKIFLLRRFSLRIKFLLWRLYATMNVSTMKVLYNCECFFNEGSVSVTVSRARVLCSYECFYYEVFCHMDISAMKVLSNYECFYSHSFMQLFLFILWRLCQLTIFLLCWFSK